MNAIYSIVMALVVLLILQKLMGRGKREVNKSVEAKDAIYMVLSVRNHY